jgi:hypothetical protein
MLEFIIFIFATIGLSFIITIHYIFKWLRDYLQKINPGFLGKGIKCNACVGFWTGLIIRSIQIISTHQCFHIDLILYGFVSSFLCYLAYLLIKPLIDKYD